MNRFVTLTSIIFLIANTQGDRPNIILCMADDMGWGDPGYNSMQVTLADGVTPHPDQGWIHTPTMDAMADHGIRFDRFYAASAVCSPTRASCLTGRNPFRVGVPGANSGRLGFDETVLSEVLTAEGYACGHFGKWHLGVMTTLTDDSNRGGPGADSNYSAPWHHGYDYCFATEAKVPTYHPYRRASNAALLPTDFVHPDFYGTRYWRFPVNPESDPEGQAVPPSEINNATNGDDSLLIINEVIPYVQNAVSNEMPFFAVVWFHTPHKPIVDPQGTSNPDSSDALRDSIEDMDTAIGLLRDELEALGVRSNTMFWVTSDNGPENGVNSPNESDTVRSIRSGGFLARKRSLHEGGVRVPGILEWPDKVPVGFATNYPACTSDYYPTVLDFLNVNVSEQKPLDGISLRSVIEGKMVTRTTPIGFKYNGDKSWVNSQYKLIRTATDWELYDILNDPTETNIVATTSNINSQPVDVQNVYSNLLAEFTTWENSVNSDTVYQHPTAPSTLLSTPSTDVTNKFPINIQFSEPIAGFTTGDIVINNGTASNFAGSAEQFSVEIIPDTSGPVRIHVPNGSAFDPDGNPNTASDELIVHFTNQEDPIIPTFVTTNRLSYFQTVDQEDDVPGNQSNNLEKFSEGAINSGIENPFTTTLYARSSSTLSDRRVRAFIQFNISDLPALPVSKATLHFHAHSLNAIPDNNLTVEVIAVAQPWSIDNNPSPTFITSTNRNAITGDSITTGLNPADNTKDYTFEVTQSVRDWLNGDLANNGWQIRFNAVNINNGIGIRTNGTNGVRLVIEQEGLLSTLSRPVPGSNHLELQWNSISGQVYQVESGPEIGVYDHSMLVTGTTSITTATIDAAAGSTNAHRVYRVAIPR